MRKFFTWDGNPYKTGQSGVHESTFYTCMIMRVHATICPIGFVTQHSTSKIAVYWGIDKCIMSCYPVDSLISLHRKSIDMANSWIGKNMRRKLYARDAMTCCYCGRICVQCNTRESSNPGIGATLDHIVPQKVLAESSVNDKHFFMKRRDPKNLVVVCMSCNSSKQHTELYTWCAMTGKNYGMIIAEIARRIAIDITGV